MDRTETIDVGTRGSPLARIQTETVLNLLRAAFPALAFDVSVIRTAGDEDPKRRPARMTGKGIFTRAIEHALLDGRVDIAVHSLKDLPTRSPAGLCVAAIPERESPWDVLVGCGIGRLDTTPGLRIGTSSLRRSAQIRRAFPACRVVELRGNLDTRLRKIAAGEADAAILAAAGLSRLGRAEKAAHTFTAEMMLPAPGQGALAVQIRDDNASVRQMLAAVHCPQTAACVHAECSFLHELNGGCRSPIGALARWENGALILHGRVLSLDGSVCYEGELAGPPSESVQIGKRLADELLGAGADSLLARLRKEVPRG